jgi:hypothetical protein
MLCHEADLHDALIMAILFNTTAQSYPPSSSRHSGWFPKRKRDLPLDDARDPKRTKLKHGVMSLSRRERSRLKGLSALQGNPRAPPFHSSDKSLMRSAGIPPFLTKNPSAAFQQDYARCQQALICAESHNLPDPDNLRDRMSYIAYNSHLPAGADSSAASVLNLALEVRFLTCHHTFAYIYTATSQKHPICSHRPKTESTESQSWYPLSLRHGRSSQGRPFRLCKTSRRRS